jgi:hypothetical protein
MGRKLSRLDEKSKTRKVKYLRFKLRQEKKIYGDEKNFDAKDKTRQKV